nr:GlsB/YeaQ/YmgE family stress response membrane protein [Streptomyces coryli]
MILGLVAGAVAKFLLPGKDGGGCIGTTAIGIAGSFIGGWASATFLDRPITTGFYDSATWLAAIAGAIVLLIVFRAVSRR